MNTYSVEVQISATEFKSVIVDAVSEREAWGKAGTQGVVYSVKLFCDTADYDAIHALAAKWDTEQDAKNPSFDEKLAALEAAGYEFREGATVWHNGRMILGDNGLTLWKQLELMRVLRVDAYSNEEEESMAKNKTFTFLVVSDRRARIWAIRNL